MRRLTEMTPRDECAILDAMINIRADSLLEAFGVDPDDTLVLQRKGVWSDDDIATVSKMARKLHFFRLLLLSQSERIAIRFVFNTCRVRIRHFDHTSNYGVRVEVTWEQEGQPPQKLTAQGVAECEALLSMIRPYEYR